MLRQATDMIVPGARLAGCAGWTTAVVSAFLARAALADAKSVYAIRDRYRRTWARGLLRVLGARPRFDPGPPAPATGARFVVANHRTLIDVPLMMGMFGGGILARGDMEGWPLAGWAARHGGTIFVNRKSPESRAASLREMRRRLAAQESVTVFSEGTTFAGDEVRRFHPGAYKAVEGLDVELVPVGIAYPPDCEFTQPAFLDHFKQLTRSLEIPISICIGPGFRMGADAAAAAIAARMHDEVQALVYRARSLL